MNIQIFGTKRNWYFKKAFTIVLLLLMVSGIAACGYTASKEGELTIFVVNSPGGRQCGSNMVYTKADAGRMGKVL